jgi:hypothetical protein
MQSLFRNKYHTGGGGRANRGVAAKRRIFGHHSGTDESGRDSGGKTANHEHVFSLPGGSVISARRFRHSSDRH